MKIKKNDEIFDALSFDGVNDYVDPSGGSESVNIFGEFNNTFIVSNCEPTGQYQAIWSHRNFTGYGAILYISQTGNFELWVGNAGFTVINTNVVPALGFEYEIVVSYSNGIASISVDGVALSVPFTFLPLSTVISFHTGAGGETNPILFFGGVIRRIEFSGYYNATYIQNGDFGSATLIDHSGNGNDGTINGATWVKVEEPPTYLEIVPVSADHDITVNYKLKLKSDKKTVSIDRGASTDRYACTMAFVGETSIIEEAYNTLQVLRDNNKQVELTECNDNYFGDHVDHSIAINCVVGEMGELESKALNTRRFKVDFISTDVTLQGTPTLPSLDCLDAGWMGYNEWNTLVNETYNRNNYFVNREKDLYVFEGAYNLSKSDNADLYRYWTTQRGASFTIDDGDFGIDGMFGPNTDDIVHDVVISNIDYSDISPTRRKANITLIKVGGQEAPPTEKFTLTFNDESTYALPWDSLTTISAQDTADALVSAGKSITAVSKIEVTEGITRIDALAFSGYTYVVDGVTLPSTLTTLGNRAFYSLGFYGPTTPVIFNPISTVVFEDGETFANSRISGNQILPAGESWVSGAWNESTLLRDITVRNRVDKLEVAWYLTGLDTVTFEQNTVPTTVTIGAFNSSWIYGSNVKIYVPATGDSLATWKASLYDAVLVNTISHINDIPIGDI